MLIISIVAIFFVVLEKGRPSLPESDNIHRMVWVFVEKKIVNFVYGPK